MGTDLFILILSIAFMIFTIVCFFYMVFDIRAMRKFFLSDEYRKAIGMPEASEKERNDNSENNIRQQAIAIVITLVVLLLIYFCFIMEN